MALYFTSMLFTSALALDKHDARMPKRPARSLASYREDRRQRAEQDSVMAFDTAWHTGTKGLMKQTIPEEDDSDF